MSYPGLNCLYYYPYLERTGNMDLDAKSCKELIADPGLSSHLRNIRSTRDGKKAPGYILEIEKNIPSTPESFVDLVIVVQPNSEPGKLGVSTKATFGSDNIVTMEGLADYLWTIFESTFRRIDRIYLWFTEYREDQSPIDTKYCERAKSFQNALDLKGLKIPVYYYNEILCWISELLEEFMKLKPDKLQKRISDNNKINIFKTHSSHPQAFYKQKLPILEVDLKRLPDTIHPDRNAIFYWIGLDGFGGGDLKDEYLAAKFLDHHVENEDLPLFTKSAERISPGIFARQGSSKRYLDLALVAHSNGEVLGREGMLTSGEWNAERLAKEVIRDAGGALKFVDRIFLWMCYSGIHPLMIPGLKPGATWKLNSNGIQVNLGTAFYNEMMKSNALLRKDGKLIQVFAPVMKIGSAPRFMNRQSCMGQSSLLEMPGAGVLIATKKNMEWKEGMPEDEKWLDGYAQRTSWG